MLLFTTIFTIYLANYYFAYIMSKNIEKMPTIISKAESSNVFYPINSKNKNKRFSIYKKKDNIKLQILTV